ncbi:hypothetical protein [Mesorhizobium sp.]|uniref:hypothetical protein n=1 Tax=Mesorhizobium sp. TaxID=1871066 RepID=UPI00257C6170|nr:hypothetical protein [Mesorhizobium sp.]
MFGVPDRVADRGYDPVWLRALVSKGHGKHPAEATLNTTSASAQISTALEMVSSVLQQDQAGSPDCYYGKPDYLAFIKLASIRI